MVMCVNEAFSQMDSWKAVSAELAASSHSGKVACVLGGGLAGLACAAEFAKRGYGVCVVDPLPPSSAPASAAAAGLLDPLSPKGRECWRAVEAMDAARGMLDAAAKASSRHAANFVWHTGSLHVPRDAKHARTLQESAQELAASQTDALGVSWVEPDAAVALVGCGSSFSCPHGALHCRQGFTVDTRQYLEALWGFVGATTTARWVRTKGLAADLASWFDCVVIAAGAGCSAIIESRHMPIELCRGQVIEFAPPSAEGVAAGGDEPTGARRLSSCWSLRIALTGSVYVLPHLRAARGQRADGDGDTSADGDGSTAVSTAQLVRLDCGGTYEPCLDAQLAASQRAVPDVEHAEAQLLPALLKLFPPLAEAGRATTARAGVRAIPPRGPEGACPLAGRAHSAAGQTNVWMIGGMGSRGLLYHALVAKWLVDAAVACDARRLPDEVRRAEFATMLTRRLQAVAVTRMETVPVPVPMVDLQPAAIVPTC